MGRAVTEGRPGPRPAVVLLFGLAGLGILYLLRGLLLLLVLAFLAAYVLDPVVTRLERAVRGRGRAVAVVLLCAVLALGVLGLALIPTLAEEARVATERVPAYLAAARERLAPPLEEALGVRIPRTTGEATRSLLGSGLGPASVGGFSQVVAQALSSLAGLLAVLMNVVLFPAFTVYFLVDMPGLREHGLALLPPRARPTAGRLLGEIDGALRGLLRGQLIVCGLVAAIDGVGLYLIGLDFAALVGVGSGLINVIPTFGPLAAMAVATALAAVQFRDLLHPLLVVGLYAVSMSVDAFYISPRVVGRRVGLPPVAVLVAVLVGGKLVGFWGIVLAVPSAAILRVLLRGGIDWYRRSAFFTRPGGAP